MDPKNNDGRRPVAYLNETFLESHDARALRILSEYLEPMSHFREEKIQDTIVFFGSARIQEEVTLARLVTEWASKIEGPTSRFVVCSGGGPGIMEAANRGAREAGGKTIGLNIGLPFEQRPNEFITPELSFEFHYFFMRKFWFAYLAKALVIFPGGFGTLDELFEILTLAQTDKLAKKILVVIYGREYWDKVLNLQYMADAGTIAQEDMDLFKVVDSPEEGFEYLRDGLTEHHLGAPQSKVGERVPEIAKTRP
jgi:uncharacterized protein (TIGR00730 family)